MKYAKWLIGGLVGGAIGAAIWAGVAVATKYEIGWIAWGVGALVGLGVRMAAGEDDGAAPGILAAVIALAAVAGGKYLAAHFSVEQALGQPGATQVTDQDLTAGIADEVAEEMMAEGKTLNWPAGSSYETASKPEEYPKEVWAEATKRFQAMPADERERQKKERAEQHEAIALAIKDAARSAVFTGSFAPMDVLFFVLAVATAFKLGSGVASQS